MKSSDIKELVRKELINELRFAEVDELATEGLSKADKVKFYTEYDKMLEQAIKKIKEL